MDSKECEPYGTSLTRRAVSLGGEKELFNLHQIGESGEVELVDYMGSDDSVEYAATLGLGRGIISPEVSQDDFIQNLSAKGIQNPFKAVQLKFSIQSPISVALAFVYEPACSVNEYSGRYSHMKKTGDLPSLENLARVFVGTGNEERAREALEVLVNCRRESLKDYHALVSEEVDMARELARSILGTNNDTKYYWKIDLFSLAQFVNRYTSQLSQHDLTIKFVNEVSQIAQQVAPLSWNALMDAPLNKELRLTMPSDEEIVDSDLSKPWWNPSSTRRVTVPEFDQSLFQIQKFLDHGQFQVIDYMGDDCSFAQAARTSYGEGTKTILDDKKLVDSLIRDLHTSPVEMAEMSFMTRAPVFTDPRQFARHRTLDNDGFMGYTPVGSLAYFPDDSQFKHQDKINRQGRGKEMDPEEMNTAKELLQRSIEREREAAEHLRKIGTPEEIIRSVKGVGFYTKRWRTGDVHNIQHMLGLRWEDHAQYEIRVLAEIIAKAHQLHTPNAYESFMMHQKEGMRLSSKEINWMRERGIISPRHDPDSIELYQGVPGFTIKEGTELGREGKSAQNKLKRFLS